jgi:tetratricopeptide (TPR) repeat protein
MPDEEDRMPDDRIVQSGSGAVASGGSVAAGAGGVAVGGDARVEGGIHIHEAGPVRVAALHQLPAPPADFTGRQEELEGLQGMLKAGAAVVGIRGLGGVGKTALALKLAEALAPSYPDAQFFLDLRGAAEQEPLSTVDAMQHVILSIEPGVNPPDDPQGVAGLYRSVLNGKKALLLWDNAKDAEQVKPLLAAGCLTLITSRQHFTLPGMGRLDLDTLGQADARALIDKIAPGLDSAQADELAGLCDYLPLAVRVSASALAEAEDLPVTTYLKRLEGSKARLGLVEASLALSYDTLSEELQTRFRQLGVFPEPFGREAAAAVWEAESDSADESLGALVRYSLLDYDKGAGRYDLHDLVRLFAAERLGAEGPEAIAAHRRVCDYYFDRAPVKPETWADIQPVLLSHYHAWKAHDKDRAARVFPWFKKSDDPHALSVPVPGFLIDHGYRLTLVRHYEMALDFAKEAGDLIWAYAEYWLGDALANVGEVAAGSQHLQQALAITAESKASEVAKDAARGKFSFRAGQVSAEAGDFDAAIAAYRTALETDQKQGQVPGALITMLQIGDLYVQKGDQDGLREAVRTFEEARGQAKDQVYPAEEAMALTRLADLAKQTDPERAVQYVREALALDEAGGAIPIDEFSSRVVTSAFVGRQGARYATQLGQVAADLAMNGQPALPLALSAYSIAIARSGESQSWYEQSVTLYWLGNLFENLFLVDGREPDRPAAWACYVFAERLSGEMELPPGINPKQRLETRVLPQIDPEEQKKLAPRIESAPLEVIQEAIDRLMGSP